MKIYIQSLDLYTEILIIKTIIRIQASKIIKEIKNIYIRIIRQTVDKKDYITRIRAILKDCTTK